ncbi:MAG TPA: DUF1592 domain-containing protein [Verrucomicrobiae bacterium]
MTLVRLSLSLMAVASLLVGCSKSPSSSGSATQQTRTAKAPLEGNAAAYEKEIKPVLAKYCYGCHGDEKKKADLSLADYKDAASVGKDRKTWEKILDNIRGREMPPDGKPQPTQAQRDLITAWIDAEVFKVDCNNPDPGRVTIRRLNRAEYNRTIRDLVGVKFQPADDFPSDDSGYGFDNIGDVLSMPPVLLEKYLAAAEKILDAAMLSDTRPQRRSTKTEGRALESKGSSYILGAGLRVVSRTGEAFHRFAADKPGEYVFRVATSTRQVGPEPAKMDIRLDGRSLKSTVVTGTADAAYTTEVKAQLTAGEHRISFFLLNPFTGPVDKKGKKPERSFAIESVEILTPPVPVALPETHQRIFAPGDGITDKQERANAIIKVFAQRAFRRPVKDAEVKRLAGFVTLAEQQGESFEKGIKVALQAVLVSPHFLFRGELQPEPNNPKSVHPVNEYALASRLSYFLWSSLPDEELSAEAANGTLRKNIDTQVRRMLKDPKAEALVENFAGQWLQLRNLKLMAPDPKEFPRFDEKLRAAMERESEMYFEHIMREDRNILEFLDSDYTFVNARLARHYGIEGVDGDEFVRVKLPDSRRGGVLTHASVLALTSNPTRTSPVKRGKWVLENLLGTPPPPPPPEVPDLDKPGNGKVLTGTLRKRMEQHREDPNCATCHARMDPIGFGLENFDGIGAWRTQDGKAPIEPGGKLVSGESFSGPADLRTILLQRKSGDFVHCLAEKMLTYALGRGLEYYDKCAVEQIAKGVTTKGYKFSVLISEVVKSAPFQMRRGEGDHLSLAAAEQ